MHQIDEVIDGKYKIVESFGVGERAKIFLVVNEKTKEKNILKIFSEINNHDNLLHVNATKLIDLKEIVDIIDVGKYAGKTYYTMPHRPCTSLYEIINSDTIKPVIKTKKEIRRSLLFFRNIVRHLAKAKLCWQFHPRHLMILPDGNFFMTGLAHSLDDEKGVHFSDLTLGLMDECLPPELLRDNYCKPDGYYQYTVASIILSLLTGRLYSERDKQKMLSQISGPNKTKLALSKALSSNVKDRHQNFDEFYKRVKPNRIFAF